MKFLDTKYGDLRGQTYKGDIELTSIDLTSLEGCPDIVDGNFTVNNTLITTLKFAPKKVNGRLNISNNSLSSLEFCPEMQDGQSFYCGANPKITSLKGGPNGILSDYLVQDCSLTSFEYSPKKVLGFFFGSNNKVTTLNGCTPFVGGRFFIDNNLIEECLFDSTFRPEKDAKWLQLENNPNSRLEMEYSILVALKDEEFINDSEYLKMYMYDRFGDTSYLPQEIKDIFVF